MPMDLIRKAVSTGRRTLNEFESKQVLAAYGIPVAKEIMARDRMGFHRPWKPSDFPWSSKGAPMA